MLEAVRDFLAVEGRKVGVKPAGGIQTTKDAIKMLVLVNETAGPDWLDPRLVPARRVVGPQRPADAAPEAHRPAVTPAPTTSPWTEMIFEYAPAPESRDVVDIKPSYGLFINGEFVDGSGTPFKTVNPASEETLAEVATATEADVDRAVQAAQEGLRRLVVAARLRAGQVPVPDRPDHPGARPRAGRARSRSTTASPSGSRATSTCPWSRPTSSTTRAGPTSSSTPATARTPPRRRRARSSRGTSRC